MVVTRKEVTKKSYRKILPQIKKKDIKLIFSSSHYDGPCSGMLLFQNQKYWFEIINSSEHFFRYFAIIKLTDDEIAKEERRHTLWQKKVGMHTTYDLETQQRLPANKTYEEQTIGAEEFYKIVDRTEYHWKRYRDNEVIGWVKYY